MALGFGAGVALCRSCAADRADPILDLSLMRVPTFRLSVIAGSLTRITQGAQPFLLPLMLQLGFGMTRPQSGSITIGAALGSSAHEVAGAPRAAALRLSRQPDRQRPDRQRGLRGLRLVPAATGRWPLIFAVLAACGFFMSFQFTAYNTIAYDEIPPSG